MRRPLRIPVLGFLLAASVPFSTGHASIIHVPEDYSTVLAAVDAAVAGDSVLVGPGTWTASEARGQFTSCAYPKGGVTIIGVAGADETVIDAQKTGAGRVTTIVIYRESGSVVLEGLTITGGIASAVYGSTSGTLTIRNCKIAENGTPLSSGSILSLHATDTVLEDCELFDNVFSSINGGIDASGGPIGGTLDLRRCRFERNQGRILEYHGSNHQDILIHDCKFIDNRADRPPFDIDDPFRVFIERNLFAGNTNTSGYGSVLNLDDCFGPIRGNVFAFDSTLAGRGGAIHASDYGGEISENTFYGCHVEPPFDGSVLYLGSNTDFVLFHHNIVAECTGGGIASISAGDRRMDCNGLWNNAGGLGDYVPDPTDVFLDPQFCDPAALSFSLAETSPYLGANNPLCGQVGAQGAGCMGTDVIPSVIYSSPPGRTILEDGTTRTAPVLVAWESDTLHEIVAPDSQDTGPGRRFAFSHWENGSTNPVRSLIAPDFPRSWTASFDSLYQLDVTVLPGGTVTPTTSWYAPGFIVTITALPDSGWWFDTWTGTGAGSYTGPNPTADVTLNEPLTQTASFTKNEDVTVTTNPPGLAITVDGQPFVSPASFVWQRGTQHTVAADSIQAESGGSRLRFDQWSDGQALAHAITVPTNPLTLTAEFPYDHEVTFGVAGQGTVTPADGWWREGDTVTIEAVPGPHYVFDSWIGTGTGSYSGPDNPATITVESPIHQEADLMRIAHALSLSLSATDPSVHTGPPVGFGSVYLWLECSTEGGVRYVEADVSGSIPVTGFNQAPGVLGTGDATHLKLLFIGCGIGPQLLGTLSVADLPGGDLCLVPAADTGELRVQSCPADGSLDYLWPVDVGVYGLRTDGAPPCTTGRGCDEDTQLAVAASEPAPAPIPTETCLAPPRPNPFGGSTSIRFALAEPARVDLSIYDVTGRRVRRLESGPRPAGSHDVTWDGRDGKGGSVSAGVYFVRLRAGAVQETRHVVVLRP